MTREGENPWDCGAGRRKPVQEGRSPVIVPEEWGTGAGEDAGERSQGSWQQRSHELGRGARSW